MQGHTQRHCRGIKIEQDRVQYGMTIQQYLSVEGSEMINRIEKIRKYGWVDDRMPWYMLSEDEVRWRLREGHDLRIQPETKRIMDMKTPQQPRKPEFNLRQYRNAVYYLKKKANFERVYGKKKAALMIPLRRPECWKKPKTPVSKTPKVVSTKGLPRQPVAPPSGVTRPQSTPTHQGFMATSDPKSTKKHQVPPPEPAIRLSRQPAASATSTTEATDEVMIIDKPSQEPETEDLNKRLNRSRVFRQQQTIADLSAQMDQMRQEMEEVRAENEHQKRRRESEQEYQRHQRRRADDYNDSEYPNARDRSPYSSRYRVSTSRDESSYRQSPYRHTPQSSTPRHYRSMQHAKSPLNDRYRTDVSPEERQRGIEDLDANYRYHKK